MAQPLSVQLGEHPRAREENMVSKGQIDFETGTSPRTRGKLLEKAHRE